MDKKYQVFISSTFTDLVEERKAVTEAIINLGHIPIGMEFFPASNLSSLKYIKKLIDDADYYILIFGARYGSIEEESGKSYTQLEYEHAVSKNIPILIFYPKDLNSVSIGKTDQDYAKFKMLETFLQEAKKDRLASEYNSPETLKSKFIASLISLIRESPRIGWIKGNQDNDTILLKQLNDLRNENKELSVKLNDKESNFDMSAIQLKDYIAGFDSTFELSFKVIYDTYNGESTTIGAKTSSFKSLLDDIGYKLLDGFFENNFREMLCEYVKDEAHELVSNMQDSVHDFDFTYSFVVEIDDRTIKQILVHLEVLKLLKKESDIYYLTNNSRKYVIEGMLIISIPF